MVTSASPRHADDALAEIKGRVAAGEHDEGSLREIATELRDALRGPAGRRPEEAAGLCELLAEVTELQKAVREHAVKQRFDALASIHAGLARLRELDGVAALVQAAPEELCRSCGFDRALVSRVRGSTWVPEEIWITEEGDAEIAAQTRAYLASAEIPLTPNLSETELARRGIPALVADPVNDPRTFKEMVAATRTQAYVAAPVMPTGRVIGFLHADCFTSGRPLTEQDRDNLWTFAEGFGLIFERIVLLERIEEQRVNVRTAFRAAEAYIDELCTAEVKLARDQGHESALLAPTAAELFLPPQSRIDMLLTTREREVLQIMVSGARNNQIAEQLVISEGTVKSHVKNICRKLRAENRAEAVSKYLQLVMKESR